MKIQALTKIFNIYACFLPLLVLKSLQPYVLICQTSLLSMVDIMRHSALQVHLSIRESPCPL